MPDRWDPAKYLHFAGERERPFWELVARVPFQSPRLVVDLGCGPGTATAGLLERWPEATVLGIDNSPAMIEQAATRADPPRLTFELADIADWRPESDPDVILSNAALHWVPGHLDLFGRWLAALGRRGVLAFQVPGNFSAPSHTLLAGLVASPRWRDRLPGLGEVVEVHPAREYLERLGELGAAVDVWETTYLHVLSGADPVLEWVRGSALRPYLAALDPDEGREFSATYAEQLRRAYPSNAAGETVFPFRRVFVVAQLR